VVDGVLGCWNGARKKATTSAKHIDMAAMQRINTSLHYGSDRTLEVFRLINHQFESR
jgi:hypothetical protein